MSKNIFHPDSGLMITMSQITDAIFLSLFWLLGCIPVVTIGASSAALYDAAYYGFRKGDRNCWKRFAGSFKGNLKAGIVPSLVYILLFTGTLWLVIQIWNAAVYGSVSWMLFSGAALIGVLILGILSVMFPMLSRFENSLLDLLKNTLLLSLGNLPRTLALGILTAVCLYLCVRFIFPLFFLPGLTALISTLLLEPMFKPYIPEELSENAAR